MENQPTTTLENGGTVTPQNTPVIAEPTAPTNGETHSVDVSEIQRVANEAAEKKSNAVFKSMLEQQGYTPEEVSAVVKEWKAKQMTPEKEMEMLRSKLVESEKTNKENELRFKTIGKGVPADKVSQYIKLAESYSNDDTDFSSALDKAIEAFPFEKPPAVPAASNNVPSFAGPSTGAPDKDNDPFIIGFKKGLK